MSTPPTPPPDWRPQPPRLAPPALPPPNPSAGQAPRHRSSTPMVVGIVVVSLVAGAVIGALVSRSGDRSPTLAPVATSAPADTAATTSTTTPGSADVTLPNITAPPTTAPQVPVTTGGATGEVDSMVAISNGVTIAVPQGWDIYSEGENSVEFGIDDGGVFVIVGTGYDSAATGIDDYLPSLEGLIDNLEIAPTEPSDPISPVFVDMQSAYYRGVWGSSQGGSSPLIGWVAAGLRADGVVVIFDMMWTDDGSGTAPKPFLDGVTTMLTASTLG